MRGTARAHAKPPQKQAVRTDGVEDPATGEGFQVFAAFSDVTAEPLPYLNPRTQESVLGDPVSGRQGQEAHRYRSVTKNKAEARAKVARADCRSAVTKHLAP